MITHYDMANGEIILDDPQNEQSESIANVGFAQLRLQTVAEAIVEEKGQQKTPAAMPDDLANTEVAAFIATQK